MNKLFLRGRVGMVVALAASALCGGAAYGAFVAAGASDPGTTYYACLTTSKTLVKVGTVSPKKCPASGQLISWNSVGPQGNTGNTGQTGNTGNTGAAAPEAQSTTGRATQAGSDISMNLPAGTYALMWQLPDTFPDGCSWVATDERVADFS